MAENNQGTTGGGIEAQPDKKYELITKLTFIGGGSSRKFYQKIKAFYFSIGFQVGNDSAPKLPNNSDES